MKKFEKGKTYKLKYTKSVAIRRNRNGHVSETQNKTINSEYEFIGNRGSKFHFYDPWSGIDVLFSKAEAIAAHDEACPKYLGREIQEKEVFSAGGGTFCDLNAAMRWAANKGYSYGSLCGDMPVALKRGAVYDISEKWRNLTDLDIKGIDGVITSSDFREGPVTVILFESTVKIKTKI
jgi:hypothetical protein